MNSGIYRVTITADDDIYVYIGQSVNISKRWNHHLHYLRKNKHANSHMQRLFNKYGECNFTYEVIERCKPEDLTLREQHFMDVEVLKKINFGKAADAPRRGMKNSEKHNETLRQYNKNRTVSEETKLKISKAGKGRKPWNKDLTGIQEAWNKGKSWSEEMKRKMSDSHKGKPWSEARRKAYELRWAIDALG